MRIVVIIFLIFNLISEQRCCIYPYNSYIILEVYYIIHAFFFINSVKQYFYFYINNVCDADCHRPNYYDQQNFLNPVTFVFIIFQLHGKSTLYGSAGI